jgi:glycosyltransferase involved in cell wall biosynthesis
MNIAFVIPSLHTGGAERQLAALAGGLARRGHGVSVLVFAAGGALEADLANSGVRLVRLDKRGRLGLPLALLRLAAWTRRERPDVLHGYLPVPNALCCMIASFVHPTRVVLGVRASFMDLSRYGAASRLCYWLETKLSPLAHAIIANSEAGLREARRRGMRSEVMAVVRNGIDTTRFYPDPEAGAQLRAQWGVGAPYGLPGDLSDDLSGALGAPSACDPGAAPPVATEQGRARGNPERGKPGRSNTGRGGAGRRGATACAAGEGCPCVDADGNPAKAPAAVAPRPEPVVLVGLVGRLDAMKDHPAFLRAAARAARDDERLRFVCIGGGPAEYAERLAFMARDLGLADKLVWAGEVRDMRAAYSALDVACSSSRGEGFSNALAEAMACGVPCAVTDVGDSAHLVGATGVVASPGDTQALAVAILETAARVYDARVDHHPGPGEAARGRILARFSLDRLIADTEKILSQLVSSN